MLYAPLSSAAQAAFAGLDGAARRADLDRSVADLPGGFAKKTVSGRDYWYYQLKDADGKPVQSYVGPDDEATRALIASHADPIAKAAHRHLVQLSRAAIELGCIAITPQHARVIERLANAGLFSAGALLAGTHVFLGYQNLFGVIWQGGAATLDLDFAHAGRNVSLGLPETLTIDAPAAIDSLRMGFTPNMKRTSYKKADEPDFDLDFLTCKARSDHDPVVIPRLGLSLQPLPFMELSLENPIRMTVLARSGPIVVNAPQPARFALHKLIVSCERPLTQRTKAVKDRAQAACLLSYLLDHDSEDVADMWTATETRGPGWRQRLHEGFSAMTRDFPDERLDQRLSESLGASFPKQLVAR